MTDSERITNLEKKVNNFIDVYSRTILFDKEIHANKVYFKNDVYLPSRMAFFGGDVVSKHAAITAPGGGTTVDSQARTAINDVIAAIKALNLTL